MGRKVIWTDEVVHDLDEIADYIAFDSPHYASEFVKEVLHTGKTHTDAQC